MLSSRPPEPDSLLIRRKLTIPPAPERLVVRERINRLMAELIGGHPLVWVCATAGSGKTTAVAQVLPDVQRPVAWLTLDQTDAAAGRLVTYLEATIGAQVPSARGVASAALAARLPHAEAAGLLAEAVGEAPLLLVIDELERIARAPAALSVIGALVRYAPPAMRIVMISRVELEIALDSTALGRAVTISESDLAFRIHEAAAALASAGRADLDPSHAVEVTGGWVAGVLFEAWRSTQHVAGMGGEADALHGYLSSQILDQLSSADREFLITASVLDDVTAARAAALGETDAAARLASLRCRHLPVAWRDEGHSLRCHARLREYLLERLERRGTDAVQRVRAAHAELLLREGHDEDAVEEFLRAGMAARAIGPAQDAIGAVIDRLDYPVAERWLSAFSGLPGADSSRLAVAQMMLALGREDYARCGHVADRLHIDSERQRLARESPGAAGMMAWSYWHLGRWRDAKEVGSAAVEGPEMEAVRFTLNLVDHTLVAGARPITPMLTGSPLDALVIRVLYAHGRLRTLAEAHSSGWTAAVTAPWRIGLLRATGHPAQALELYERIRVADWAHVWLHAMVGPEILIDLQRPAQAREAVMRGRELTRESGSLVFVMLNELIEAKMEIRLGANPHAALAVLDRLRDRQAASEYRFIGEAADTWRGLSLLALEENERALTHLEDAVETMTASDRILELPTAAVYLSEARWRAGDEDGADAAADIAYEAARRQGSNHYLLQALAAFPAVVTRRLDAEPHADSPWHELGRALRSQNVSVDIPLSTRVELVEFGEPAILVDGLPAPRPRIAKSYELLAFLISLPNYEASRETLLGALFDGRSDESARAYLRQAVHQLREVLPSDVRIVSDAHRTSLGDAVIVSSDSARLAALLAEAARLQDEERIEATKRAIAIAERGQYLAGLNSIWIEERRDQLARLVLDARHDAAELSFATGRYADAARLVEATLIDDPFREAAHRLEMRIANAVGDEDRVIAAYRRCERRLSELGTVPSTSTRQLLETLRR